MQPAFSMPFPEPLPVAMPQLSEKPRLGVQSKNQAWHLGFNVRNSTAVLGLQFRCSGIVSGPVVARYYSSILGRFMTPDWAVAPTAVPYASFGDPQTLNLYGYVDNNPLTGIDAEGHWTSNLPFSSCGKLTSNCTDPTEAGQNAVFEMQGEEAAASWMTWNSLSEDEQGDIPGGWMTWEDMDSSQQAYVANSLDGALAAFGVQKQSALQAQIDQAQEKQREALAAELAREAAVKHLPETCEDILQMLHTKETVGGNTEFLVNVDPNNNLYQLISQLGLTAGGENGREIVCRSGGLMNSPHFDHGKLHMDNFNGNWNLPLGTTLHFFVDVFVGTVLYGDVPFSR